MKNSAWYSKLWRNKLNKLPLKTDADTAWTNMHQLLNEQLPVNSTLSGGNAAKPLIAKLPALLMYILPVAVIISGAVYFALKGNKPLINKKIKKQTEIIRKDTALNSLTVDSTYNQTSKTDTNKTESNLPVNYGKPYQQHHTESGIQAATNNGQLGGVITSVRSIGKVNPTDFNTEASLSKVSINDPKLDSVKNGKKEEEIAGNKTVTGNVNTQAVTHNADVAKVADQPAVSPASKNNLMSKKGKIKKPKLVKTPKFSLKNSNETDEPDLTYGVKFGINRGSTKNLLFGVFSSFRIRPKWFIDAEVLGNTGKTVSGNFTHESFFRPDSIAPFSVSSSRKLYTLDVPVSIRYKISNILSIKAGPVINIPIKQSAIDNRITNLPDTRDTLYHGKEIMASLTKAIVTPKINIGVSAGINITVNRFIIEGRYMQNAPYTITSGLGSYKVKSQYFQISLGYQLNKRRKN